jgi:hypothetical protein
MWISVRVIVGTENSKYSELSQPAENSPLTCQCSTNRMATVRVGTSMCTSRCLVYVFSCLSHRTPTSSTSVSQGTSLLWLWTALHFVLLFKFVELATACVLGSLFGGLSVPKVRWPVLFSSCLNFFGLVRCASFYVYFSPIDMLHYPVL